METDSTTGNDMEQTPLHRAAADGRAPDMEVLLKQDGAPDAPDTEGKAPLHHAAANGRISAMEMLLANGANISAKDKGGRTPLMEAAIHGQAEAVDFLLRHGASRRDKSDTGETALIYAAAKGDMPTVKKLAGFPAPLRTKDGSRHNALWHARHAQHLSESDRRGLCSFLKRAMLRRSLGYTAGVLLLLFSIFCHLFFTGWNTLLLKRACLNNDPAMAGVWMRLGAEVDSKTLHTAVQKNQWELVRVLLDNGANPNARDKFGETPLHDAARRGYNKMVKLLLHKGANPRVLNKKGKYPLDVIYVWYLDPEGQSATEDLLLDYMYRK